MMQLLPENDENVSLDLLAREGARQIIASALQQEVAETVARCAHLKDEHGYRLVVRNGTAKTRHLTCGSGTIAVNAPRVHDRRAGMKFTSKILPPYLRRTPNVNAVMPALYLKGISGNAFEEALQRLLGNKASGLSKSSIAAMKQHWLLDMQEWKRRSIDEEFVYLWADGVNVNVRLGDNKKLCLLVIIGVTTAGEKKLVAVEGGYRESRDSWSTLFGNLLARGLKAPLMIVADGGLGLWAAIDGMSEFANTKRQRCWVHKIRNVLDKLPNNLQGQARSMLADMMSASHKKHAVTSYRTFQRVLHEKYPQAVACLENDWEELTAFYAFPAKHWKHLKTTNPIESIFSPLKARLRSTKGVGSERMGEAMAYKLLKEAEQKWKRICGYDEIQNILSGKLYKDGEMLDGDASQRGVA